MKKFLESISENVISICIFLAYITSRIICKVYLNFRLETSQGQELNAHTPYYHQTTPS